MPLWTKHYTQAEFHVKHWCLPPAPTGSAGTVWPCHAAPLRECFKSTNWVMFSVAWDIFDELADMKTSHSILLRVKICAPWQPLAVNRSFLRSRTQKKQHVGDLIKAPREPKNQLKWVPIMPLFYPSDSDCFLRYSCLYMAKHFELLKAEEAIYQFN